MACAAAFFVADEGNVGFAGDVFGVGVARVFLEVAAEVVLEVASDVSFDVGVWWFAGFCVAVVEEKSFDAECAGGEGECGGEVAPNGGFSADADDADDWSCGVCHVPPFVKNVRCFINVYCLVVTVFRVVVVIRYTALSDVLSLCCSGHHYINSKGLNTNEQYDSGHGRTKGRAVARIRTKRK